MKKKASLISGLLLLLIYFSTSAQAFTLTETVNQAYQTNLDLAIARLNLANAQIDYEKNIANNLFAGSRYIELQGDIMMLQAENTYQQTGNMLIIEIVQSFYTTHQLEHDLILRQKQYDLEQSRLKETQRQYQTGHKGSMELLQQQISYNNAAFALTKAASDLTQHLKEFAHSLNINVQELSISSLPELESLNLSYNEVETIALENSLTLLIRLKAIEAAKADLERLQSQSTPQLDLQRAHNDLTMRELQYQKTQQDLISDISASYNAYQEAKKNIDLAELNLEQAARNLDITERQLQSGLRTQNDLIQAQIALMQAQRGLLNAKLLFHTAQLRLKMHLGFTLGGLFDVETEI